MKSYSRYDSNQGHFKPGESDGSKLVKIGLFLALAGAGLCGLYKLACNPDVLRAKPESGIETKIESKQYIANSQRDYDRRKR